MQTIESKGLDKLSSLAEELEAVECQLGESAAVKGLKEARQDVVGALIVTRASMFRMAEALIHYRSFFKAQKTWLKVLDLIAAASGSSAKTLSRMLEKYEAACELGPLLFDGVLEQRIDPRLPGNRPVVEMLKKTPKPATREEASAAVKAAKLLTMKRAQANDSGHAEPGGDAFADRLLKLVEPWYHAFPLETRDAELRYILEKLVNGLRADVRELRLYSRPDQVRRPVSAKEAVCVATQ